MNFEVVEVLRNIASLIILGDFGKSEVVEDGGIPNSCENDRSSSSLSTLLTFEVHQSLHLSWPIYSEVVGMVLLVLFFSHAYS